MIGFPTALFRGGVAVLLALTVAGCAARVSVSGNKPDEEDLARIVIGQTEKARVAELLGSPSSIAAFDENVWLYISQRSEATAFFEPKVTEQEVVLIRFDPNGAAETVNRYTLKDGQPIVPSDRKTPTAGRDFTILQQLFGNFGRFANDGPK